MMVLGFAAALYVVMADVRRDKDLLRWQAWDLFIVMVVASVLGSKFGHVLFESEGHHLQDGRLATGVIDLLRDDPWHWARLGESGSVWYGGLLGSLGTAIYYVWRRPQLNGWLYSDAFAPAIAAGAVVGRLGCFLAGCCHGVETDAAWGVKFPQLPHPVHPTQLYDAAAALILFGVTFTRFPRRRFDGEVIAILLMGYAVLRAFTEAFRGDAERGGLGPFSTSQLISIPMFLAGLAIYMLRSKQSGALQRDALEKAG
jgi:phosphatidylglycerol:prolipoprotein diacylglycerol transferase